jgi:hypothetical protein
VIRLTKLVCGTSVLGVLTLGVAPVPSGLARVTLKVRAALPSAVVQLLRAQACAPVCFIASGSDRLVSLDLQEATVRDVLADIARQDPTYRAETISDKDVLYPARAEFQRVVSGIDIKDAARLDACYVYLKQMRPEVPALSNLAAPFVVGDHTHPIFSTKVSVRPRGRVIEQLMDLIGADKKLYLEFGRAMSGVPEMLFQWVKC